MGPTCYYYRFIKNYASIVALLTDLLRKEAFLWSETAQDAFEKLKIAITKGLVIAPPNFKQKFVLETDALGQGIGAVLSQNGHPIGFFSKKLSPRMQKQGACVRELYAVTESIAKFRHYLLSHKFIMKIDHQSLKHLLDQSLQTSEQQA